MDGMRIRNRDSRNNVIVKWSNSGTEVTANHLAGVTQDFHDVVTANFEEKQRRGMLVFNPMRSYKTEWSGSTYGPKKVANNDPNAYNDYKDYWPQHHVGYCGAQLNPDVSDLLVQVATESRARIAEPDVDGLVILGEFASTMRLLKNPLKTGLKIANHFQRDRTFLVNSLQREMRRNGYQGKVRFNEKELRPLKDISDRASRLVDDLTNLYLEVRYGFRPLIGDIHDIAVSLLDGKRSPRQTARAFGSFNTSRTFTGAADKGNFIRYNYTDTETCSIQVRSGYLYEYYVDAVRDPGGVSVDNLPRAVWELIPLSFVADWFLNIGSLISAVSPKGGTHLLGDWTVVTRENRCDRQYTGASVYNQTGFSITRQPYGTCRITYTEKIRYVGPGNRFIGLTWNSAGLRSILSGSDLRTLDLFALIAQRLK